MTEFEKNLELKNFIESFIIKNDCSSLEMKSDEEGHLHIIASFKDFDGERIYVGYILNKYVVESSNLELDEQIKFVFNNILQPQIDEYKLKITVGDEFWEGTEALMCSEILPCQPEIIYVIKKGDMIVIDEEERVK